MKNKLKKDKPYKKVWKQATTVKGTKVEVFDKQFVFTMKNDCALTSNTFNVNKTFLLDKELDTFGRRLKWLFAGKLD